MTRKHMLNAGLFIAGWSACILAGNSFWLVIALAVLLVHFSYVSSWAAEGKLVVSCMLIGTAISSAMLQMNWLSITGHTQLAPLWLAISWALIGTLLNHALGWSAQPWWRASMLGAIAVPVLVLLIVQRPDVALTPTNEISLPLLAITGAVLLPVLHGFAQLYREQFQQRSR